MEPRVRSFICVGVAILGMAASVAAQQRPLVTEDPEPIGDGLVLLEAGFDHSWSYRYPVSGLTGDLLRWPVAGLSFGMGENAEIQIDGISRTSLTILDRVDAPLSSMVDVPGDTSRGFEDMVVGAKVKIMSEGSRAPAIGLRFATRLPNASNETGLGLDTMDFFQSLLIAKTVQSIRVVGNAGLGILSDPTRGDRQNDVLTIGVSVARALTNRAEVVGEVNGRVSTRRGTPPPGTGSRGIMLVGLRYTRGTVRIDGGVFAGLTGLDPPLGMTGGVTWVFESFLNP